MTTLEQEREAEKRLQKQWFQAKLAAEKQKVEVAKKVKDGVGDFVLLDTRDRASFEKDHLPGAVSMPLAEVGERAGELDPGKEYVTYCWHKT
jgi:rhodanese-related sulfurtransferase